jgi:hypothetical protein
LGAGQVESPAGARLNASGYFWDRSCARITWSQYLPSELKPSASMYLVKANSFVWVSSKLSKPSEIKYLAIVAQGDF